MTAGKQGEHLAAQGLAEHRVERLPDPVGDCPCDGGGDQNTDERRGDRAELDVVEPAAHDDEQGSSPGDVHERRRKRDPPDAKRRERDIENGVEKEVAERDRRRHPVVLQAEEGTVQHQHRPVERQPEAERGEARGDSGSLWRRERSTLVNQTRQRFGQNGGDDAGRYEQERDLPEPEGARPPEAVEVVPRREARERREEHGRDRNRKHPLRQHVDAERLLIRNTCCLSLRFGSLNVFAMRPCILRRH